MDAPRDALAAVTHPDPYPFYAERVVSRPFAFDASLRLWVAASAEAVRAVLASPACRVRPSAEPVPPSIVGTPAGSVFGKLIRMGEGEAHARGRAAVGRALGSVSVAELRERASRLGASLWRTGDAASFGARLTGWCLAVPVSTVASVIGAGDDALPEIARLAGQFVACLSPLSKPPELARASEAAEELQSFLGRLLASPGNADTLAAGWARHAQEASWRDDDAILANLLGLLSQTYEATAGLIGNTLIAFSREPGLIELAHTSLDALSKIVAEVSRHDSSVQNTRRFVAEPTDILGNSLVEGEAILVLLAAANRDPQANVEADRFRVDRTARVAFGFGSGRHQCPGEAWAIAIATGAVSSLLGQAQPLELTQFRWSYRPSLNARVPTFHS